MNIDEVLDAIRTEVGADNLAVSCNRDECDVFLADLPTDRIIIDADLAFPAHGWEGERCDFVVFLFGSDANLYAVPVELKSGSIPIAKTVRQLRKGAEFVDRFGPEEPPPACRPILIHGRRISFRERKRLNRLKVTFRGLELTIKTARCGHPGNLALALEV
jgi:hypothetical protein